MSVFENYQKVLIDLLSDPHEVGGTDSERLQEGILQFLENLNKEKQLSNKQKCELLTTWRVKPPRYERQASRNINMGHCILGICLKNPQGEPRKIKAIANYFEMLEAALQAGESEKIYTLLAEEGNVVNAPRFVVLSFPEPERVRNFLMSFLEQNISPREILKLFSDKEPEFNRNMLFYLEDSGLETALRCIHDIFVRDNSLREAIHGIFTNKGFVKGCLDGVCFIEFNAWENISSDILYGLVSSGLFPASEYSQFPNRVEKKLAYYIKYELKGEKQLAALSESQNEDSHLHRFLAASKKGGGFSRFFSCCGGGVIKELANTQKKLIKTQEKNALIAKN